MILSTRNWLADLDPDTDLDFATAGLGYENANLWRGGIARAWRSASSGTTHRFACHLTPERPVGMVALFDVRTSAGRVTSIEVRRSDAWDPFGIGTVVGSIALGARCDGALHLPVPIQSESWLVSVFTSEPSLLTVGGLWLGEATTLPRAYATRQDQVQYHTIGNTMESQTVRTTALADYTRRLTLGFDRLTNVERDELLEVWHGARGDQLEAVVLPTDDPTDPIFGRLQSRMAWGVDFPVNTGLSLEFLEDGRALGA